MNTTVQGKVELTSANPFQGRNGEVILRSFQLAGSKLWYRTGTTELAHEGDYVKFRVMDSKNNVDFDSFEVIDEPKVKAAPAPAPRAFSSNTGYSKGAAAAKNQYWDDKAKRDIEIVEPRITLSASQRDAIDFIDLALRAEVLDLGKGTKAQKYAMLLGFVDEVTGRFYKQRIEAAATAETLTASAPVETEETTVDE